MSQYIDSDVWRGLDRRSFHANAVLLELKCRGQGPGPAPARATVWFPVPEAQLTWQCMANGLLDDVALISAASGGKDNVSAVCLEAGDDDKSLVFRIATNDARPREPISRLLELLQAPPSSGSGSCGDKTTPRDDILIYLLSVCERRLRKHSDRLLNEFRHLGFPSDRQLVSPAYQEHGHKTESSQDISLLGKLDSTTHMQYVRLGKARYRDIARLSQALRSAGAEGRIARMMALVKSAYLVRRSASFKQFLECNIRVTNRSNIREASAEALVERLGKLSRFYRAALTLTAFGEYLVNRGLFATAQYVETARLEVPELQHETPAALRNRGGALSSNLSDRQLASMLGRWRDYRLHAEMQLIVYYEEHPDARMVSRYIGCDKLCCFLCYRFIQEHGQFAASGCHQSLYSLWTIPRSVRFVDPGRADKFHLALRALCDELERKVRRMKESPASFATYAMQNESVARLSRASVVGSWVDLPAHRTMLHADQQLPDHLRQFGAESHLPVLEEKPVEQADSPAREESSGGTDEDTPANNREGHDSLCGTRLGSMDGGQDSRSGISDPSGMDDPAAIEQPLDPHIAQPAEVAGTPDDVHVETVCVPSQRQRDDSSGRESKGRGSGPQRQSTALLDHTFGNVNAGGHVSGAVACEYNHRDPLYHPAGPATRSENTDVYEHADQSHSQHRHRSKRQRGRARRHRLGSGRGPYGRGGNIRPPSRSTGSLRRAWEHLVRRVRKWMVENVLEVYG